MEDKFKQVYLNIINQSNEEGQIIDEVSLEGGAQAIGRGFSHLKNAGKNIIKSAVRVGKGIGEGFTKGSKEVDDANEKKNAFRDLKSKANAGDADAQYKFGIQLVQSGEQKNISTGVTYLQKAAKQGNEEAKKAIAKITNKQQSSKSASSDKTDDTAKSSKATGSDDTAKPSKATGSDDAAKPSKAAGPDDTAIVKPENPKRYPISYKRKKGLYREDERHIILKHFGKKKELDPIEKEFEIVKRKIDKLNNKLKAGQKITIEEEKFIKSLRDII